MLRIRDNLVRIQICGSVPLTNRFDTGSGSCYFRHDRQDGKKKIFLFEATFSSFFNDKKPWSHKTVGITGYSCVMIEGSGAGSVPWQIHQEPGDPKTYGSRTATQLFYIICIICLLLESFCPIMGIRIFWSYGNPFALDPVTGSHRAYPDPRFSCLQRGYGTKREG